MGVSYGGNVIAGVGIDEFAEQREHKSIVTKYNEDTGEPYQVDNSHKYWVIKGLPSEHFDYVEQMLEWIDDHTDLDVVYDTSYGGTDFENSVVGVKLARLSLGDFVGVRFKEIVDATGEAQNLFQEQLDTYVDLEDIDIHCQLYSC